jgi:hypothetical protein
VNLNHSTTYIEILDKRIWRYYLFKRQYRLAISSVITAGLLTLTPIIITKRPVVDTILFYLKTMQTHGQGFDNPIPFNKRSVILKNLEPLVYREFNGESPVNTVLYWIMIGAMIQFAFYLILKTKSTSVNPLLDFSLISALSFISLYHRAYDTFLIFPAILSIYIYIQSIDRQNVKRMWIAGLVGFIAVHILPSNVSVRLASIFPTLLDSYVFRVMAPFQIWANLAIFVTLLWLKERQLKQSDFLISNPKENWE